MFTECSILNEGYDLSALHENIAFSSGCPHSQPGSEEVILLLLFCHFFPPDGLEIILLLFAFQDLTEWGLCVYSEGF